MVESLFLFFILDVVLLHGCPQGYREFSFLLQPPFLSSSEERLGSFLKELPSPQPLEVFPPCAAPFSQGLLGRILHALETFLAMLTLWEPLTASLASHLLDNFSTLVWLRLTTCWRRTSERILSVRRAACPRSLSHAVSPSPGLVKLPRALQLTGRR